MGKVDARLQSEEELTGFFKQLTDDVQKQVGANRFVSQKEVLTNISKLTEQGVAYNLEQRALLATLSDKMVTTFNVLDDTLQHLIRVQQALETKLNSLTFDSDDEKSGYKILMSALDVPLRAIADNAGAKGDIVVDNVRSEADAYGYDALLNRYTDMFSAGIVDPAKVTRSALENAASVASMLLTTEAAVVDIPEESKGPDMSSMAGMGGMGGMM